MTGISVNPEGKSTVRKWFHDPWRYVALGFVVTLVTFVASEKPTPLAVLVLAVILAGCYLPMVHVVNSIDEKLESFLGDDRGQLTAHHGWLFLFACVAVTVAIGWVGANAIPSSADFQAAEAQVVSNCDVGVACGMGPLVGIVLVLASLVGLAATVWWMLRTIADARGDDDRGQVTPPHLYITNGVMIGAMVVLAVHLQTFGLLGIAGAVLGGLGAGAITEATIQQVLAKGRADGG